jgi:hypothetical protein
MMGKVTVVLSEVSKALKVKECAHIEFWNPSVEQLVNLIPYLESNQSVAYVWVYGDVDNIKDYSTLPKSFRIAVPMYLGRNREEAESVYFLNRKLLIPEI